MLCIKPIPKTLGPICVIWNPKITRGTSKYIKVYLPILRDLNMGILTELGKWVTLGEMIRN